jgi:hypothetical protein
VWFACTPYASGARLSGNDSYLLLTAIQRLAAVFRGDLIADPDGMTLDPQEVTRRGLHAMRRAVRSLVSDQGLEP